MPKFTLSDLANTETLDAAPVEKWQKAAQRMADSGDEGTAHVVLEFATIFEAIQHINSHLNDTVFTAITLEGVREDGTTQRLSMNIPEVTEG